MSDLENEVEKQAQADAEVEDLSNVDFVIPEKTTIDIYARERLGGATSYRILSIRLSTVKASIKANESVGNTSAVEQYKKQMGDLERDIKHCLRGIKVIDKECPQAKERMMELANQ